MTTTSIGKVKRYWVLGLRQEARKMKNLALNWGKKGIPFWKLGIGIRHFYFTMKLWYWQKLIAKGMYHVKHGQWTCDESFFFENIPNNWPMHTAVYELNPPEVCLMKFIFCLSLVWCMEDQKPMHHFPTLVVHWGSI